MIPDANKSAMTSLERPQMNAGAQIRTLLLSIFFACLISGAGFLLITVALAAALGPRLAPHNPEGAGGVFLIAGLIAGFISVVAMILLTLLFFTKLRKRYRSAGKLRSP